MQTTNDEHRSTTSKGEERERETGQVWEQKECDRGGASDQQSVAVALQAHTGRKKESSAC